MPSSSPRAPGLRSRGLSRLACRVGLREARAESGSARCREPSQTPGCGRLGVRCRASGPLPKSLSEPRFLWRVCSLLHSLSTPPHDILMTKQLGGSPIRYFRYRRTDGRLTTRRMASWCVHWPVSSRHNYHLQLRFVRNPRRRLTLPTSNGAPTRTAITPVSAKSIGPAG